MIPTRRLLRSSHPILTSFVLCASLAMGAMTLVSGDSAAKEKARLNVTVLNASESVVLDAAVFGSSAGHASIKSAPTTWSSRSNVRWNARWANEARYLV